MLLPSEDSPSRLNAQPSGASLSISPQLSNRNDLVHGPSGEVTRQANSVTQLVGAQPLGASVAIPASRTINSDVGNYNHNFLPQNFDPLKPPNLAAVLDIGEGKPYAWATFLRAGEPVLALQVAEDALGMAVAAKNINYEELLTCTITAAATFLSLQQNHSAHCTVEEARDIIRGKWPERALSFELAILNWAVCVHFTAEAEDSLNNLVSLFDAIHSESTDAGKRESCSRVLYLLERIADAATKSEQFEIANACGEIDITLVEHAFGMDALEVAARLHNRARDLFETDPQLSGHYLRRTCEILETNGLTLDAQYVAVMAQYGYVLEFQGEGIAALQVAKKLHRVARAMSQQNSQNPEAIHNSEVSPLTHALCIRGKVAQGTDRFERAHALYMRLYKHLEKSPSDHEEYISVLESIRDNAYAGDLTEIENWAHKSLRERTGIIYGPGDTHTISATNDLISFLHRHDRHEAARKLALVFLDELRTTIGESAFMYIDTLRTLSAVESYLAPKERAESPLVKALYLARKHLKNDDRKLVLSILGNMAEVADSMGDLAEQLRLQTLSVRYTRLIYGVENLQYAQALLDRGETYLGSREFVLAEVDLCSALDILSAHHMEEHFKISQALQGMGHLTCAAGDLEGALEYFEEALEKLHACEFDTSNSERSLNFDLGLVLLKSIEIVPDRERMQRALDCFGHTIAFAEKPGNRSDDDLDLAAYSAAHQLALELDNTELADQLSIPLARLKIQRELDDDAYGEEETV